MIWLGIWVGGTCHHQLWLAMGLFGFLWADSHTRRIPWQVTELPLNDVYGNCWVLGYCDIMILLLNAVIKRFEIEHNKKTVFGDRHLH